MRKMCEMCEMKLKTAVGVSVVLALVLAGSVVFERAPSPSDAVAAGGPTPELAEKERRSCVTCHTAMGRAELNRAGTYYKEHRSFEGYDGELPPQVPADAPAPTNPSAPPDPPPPQRSPRN
jgi:hypothetical protein